MTAPEPTAVDLLEAAFVALDDAHDDLASVRANLRQLRELVAVGGDES